VTGEMKMISAFVLAFIACLSLASEAAKGGRAVGSRQSAGGRRQEAGGRKQEAGSRRQEAGGRRQEAGAG